MDTEDSKSYIDRLICICAMRVSSGQYFSEAILELSDRYSESDIYLAWKAAEVLEENGL